MSWPQDPQPFGDDHPSSFLGALYSPDVPNAETSHDDYRSVDDPTRLHRAGVIWTTPVHVDRVRLRWRAGWASRRFRVVVREGEAWIPVGDWAAADAVEEREIGRVVSGVALEQAPGGGPEKAPGTLRLAALSLPGPCPLELRRRGIWHRPQMPLAFDDSPWTVLDVSDADALRLEGSHPRISLDVIRAGGVGDPAAIAAWLALPTILSAGGAPVACARWIDASQRDLAGGFTRVILVPDRPIEAPTIHLPVGPHAMGLLRVAADEPSGEAFTLRHQPSETKSFRRHAPDALSLEEAEAITLPLRHAASLGRPGRDGRVGLLPDGGIVVRRGAHAHVMHLRVAVDGAPVVADGWRVTRYLSRSFGPLSVVVDDAGVCLNISLEPHRHSARITVAICAREGLWPRPLDEIPFWHVWTPPAHPTGAWQTEVECRRVTFRLLDDRGPALGPLYLTAPELPFRPRLNRLLEEASLFVQGDHRVCYGLFPSVYADAVFGLEEDYLFRGLAMWGFGDLALAAFRRTYLSAEHLDKRHYLHDLRNGLTPWQLAHLLRLTGTDASWLTAEEVELLRACARWILTERAKTADATGEPTAGGWRVFPGLLPPFRYGGDLDFPTQSLYVNAANWRGLEAIAALTGDDHAAALADYRVAIERAFEAVRDGDRQPLHSGGTDPGEYFQLMACGIFDPLEFFPPDHPTARRIDAQVAREGRLFSQLPRFDGWGAAPGIDAVYCHGYLINALRRGQRAVFQAGLCGLFAHAFDRDLLTAREVGPIQLDRRDDGHWLPGRRLSRSEPCVGSLGVALMLLRHALVTELPEPGHLLIAGGLLDGWRAAPIRIRGLATLYGPVDLELIPGQHPKIHAPGATRITVCS